MFPKPPFLSINNQTVSHRNFSYALSQFVAYEQKSSLLGTYNYQGVELLAKT